MRNKYICIRWRVRTRTNYFFISYSEWCQYVQDSPTTLIHQCPSKQVKRSFLKSFTVHSKDFKSTQDLAKYLIKVSADDRLFASYFWWREHYHAEVYSIGFLFLDSHIWIGNTSLSRHLWNPENLHGANYVIGCMGLEENQMWTWWILWI